ncbi:MAG: DinB family protein [Bryobacteraceae bacterium]|jgi:uncharacterized damage-inducible protein DinB
MNSRKTECGAKQFHAAVVVRAAPFALLMKSNVQGDSVNRTCTLTLMGALLGAAALNAQNPLSSDLKGSYTGIKSTITKAAEEMPEADYSFKASPMERTYGEIVGHIADVQLALCGNVKGEQKKGDAGSKTTKADLAAALKASFDYCDGAYDSQTDADAATMVTLFGPRKATKLAVLNFNIAHDNEMYGQMVVYLRIKGLVPPSSQRRQP